MKLLNHNSYALPIALAVALHLLIVLSAIFAWDFTETEELKPKRAPIVQATVVDIKQTVIGKRIEENKKAQVKKAQAVAAKKEKDRAKKKRDNERAALEDKKKQLALTKKKQEAAKRKAEEERDNLKKIDAEKKAEEERKRKEAARLANEEKKRQEELKRKRAEEDKKRAEQQMLQALAEEESRERDIAEQQMVQSLSSLINDRVARAWIRPPSARNNMKTFLKIFFLPTGEVSQVNIVEGSGDALFDQRAVDAVKRVERIEELAELESYVFERNFRQVDLIFNPQDLRR